MIFTGDVAIADEDSFSFIGFDGLKPKSWSINLEGAVLMEGSQIPGWGTYNSPRWVDSFSGFRLAPVFLANNHIHDLVNGVAETRDYLIKQNLESFGAGADTSSARISVTTESCGHEFTLLGFGWPVIGCKPADRQSAGVNRLEGCQVLSQTREALLRAGEGKVVVVMHGNYEFEKYPQPAHRKLARQLIDEGVYAVVCHHPHIVSPVERYKGRTIAYSLGNWAFSYGRFFKGRLKFPEASFHQIALELNADSDRVHHAWFEPPSTVRYIRSESVNAADFSLKPEFEGFNDAEYLDWFKVNRVKRKALPIYRNADDSFGNTVRDSWVGVRQRLIDNAAKIGLKKIRRS